MTIRRRGSVFDFALNADDERRIKRSRGNRYRQSDRVGVQTLVENIVRRITERAAVAHRIALAGGETSVRKVSGRNHGILRRLVVARRASGVPGVSAAADARVISPRFSNRRSRQWARAVWIGAAERIASGV